MSEKNSFPMTGGDGKFSYAKNSNPQREAAERAKAVLVSAIIENLDINEKTSPSCFRITDMGCSTGPNTYIAVNNIIEAVTQKYKTKPEFQVFFNDHVSNDFNLLFTNLPLDKPYTPAAVPGSFYSRLFPRASIDFVHSAFALHWLSKLEPICNEGRIQYAGAPGEVVKAYVDQYAKDIEGFLDARGEEVVPGGLMAILIPGRPDGTTPGEFSLGPTFQLLESSLVDMANEGKISKGDLDLFNLPIYSPSLEEIRTAVKKNGCFDIAKLELDTRQGDDFLWVPPGQVCRSGFESIITKHFGGLIVEDLFKKYDEKYAAKEYKLSPGHKVAASMFILLKRKVTSE
ncbi:hypothetical protein ACFE04_011111 [Oxalis oulophora]